MANTTSGYRSVGARELAPADRRVLRHEHVETRKQVIDEITAEPSRTRESVLALACVVTESEHQRLTAVSEHLRGWDRYRGAGVDVYYDEQAGKPFIANGTFSDASM